MLAHFNAPSEGCSEVRHPPEAPSRALPGGGCSAAGANHLLGDVRNVPLRLTTQGR